MKLQKALPLWITEDLVMVATNETKQYLKHLNCSHILLEPPFFAPDTVAVFLTQTRKRDITYKLVYIDIYKIYLCLDQSRFK